MSRLRTVLMIPALCVLPVFILLIIACPAPDDLHDGCTVSYLGNGSTGGYAPTDANEYESGDTVTVFGPATLTRTGFDFADWNTEPDGTGTEYAAGDSFSMGSTDVLLYAMWQVSVHTVTFDSQGGSAADPQDVAHGGTVSALVTPSRTGFDFHGWYTGPGGSVSAFTTSTVVTASITVYAYWTAVFEIGDSGPAGGLVFYDKGSYTDGWRYLEAAPGDLTIAAWDSCVPPPVRIGATDTAIGSGAANTEAIVGVLGSNGPAAKSCSDLVVGEYADWYLPSKDELNLMYATLFLADLGSFWEDQYWSSSEEALGPTNAWYHDFSDNTQALYGKSSVMHVRAVRAF